MSRRKLGSELCLSERVEHVGGADGQRVVKMINPCSAPPSECKTQSIAQQDMPYEKKSGADVEAAKERGRY